MITRYEKRGDIIVQVTYSSEPADDKNVIVLADDSKEVVAHINASKEAEQDAIKAAEITTQVAKFTDLTPVVAALAKRGYPSLEAFFAKALSVIGDYKPTR